MDNLKLIYKSCALAALLVAMSQAAVGQAIYVHPLNAQSDEQLAEDRYACHLWAVKESGFDPSQFQEAAPPQTVRVPVPRNQTEGATAAGTIMGSIAGSVIDAGHHHGGGGTVLGAVVGTIAGAAIEGHGQKEAREKAEVEAQRQADDLARTRSERALRRSNYRRALTACMEGRDYTVR